jgi:tRNA-Thr(GGU) m(6)t(6)A37 methyltransferase TsaA
MNLTPIGYVRSSLQHRPNAPRQAEEGAPPARIEILPAFLDAIDGLEAGQSIWILTWLHQAQRSLLKVHPRSDLSNPITGVFATRSPDRPNPIGLHRGRLLRIHGYLLEVAALEAIDGTPVVDIKPVIEDLG